MDWVGARRKGRLKASPARGGGPPQAVVGCYPDGSCVVPVRRNLLAISPLSLRCRQLPSQGSHGCRWWRKQAPRFGSLPLKIWRGTKHAVPHLESLSGLCVLNIREDVESRRDCDQDHRPNHGGQVCCPPTIKSSSCSA